MSGSFESLWWNAHVHRLDLGLYAHPKEFWRNGVKTHVDSKKNSPPPKPQRRIEPMTQHHAGQPAQHTTDWAIPPLLMYSPPLNALWTKWSTLWLHHRKMDHVYQAVGIPVAKLLFKHASSNACMMLIQHTVNALPCYSRMWTGYKPTTSKLLYCNALSHLSPSHPQTQTHCWQVKMFYHTYHSTNHITISRECGIELQMKNKAEHHQLLVFNLFWALYEITRNSKLSL